MLIVQENACKTVTLRLVRVDLFESLELAAGVDLLESQTQKVEYFQDHGACQFKPGQTFCWDQTVTKYR